MITTLSPRLPVGGQNLQRLPQAGAPNVKETDTVIYLDVDDGSDPIPGSDGGKVLRRDTVGTGNLQSLQVVVRKILVGPPQNGVGGGLKTVVVGDAHSSDHRHGQEGNASLPDAAQQVLSSGFLHYHTNSFALKDSVPRLVIQQNGMGQKLPLSELVDLEQRGHHVMLSRKDGSAIQIYGKLSALMPQLEGHPFFCPHKSYCVNLAFVCGINEEYQCYQMADGKNVPIGRPNRGKAKRAYEDFLFSHTRGDG